MKYINTKIAVAAALILMLGAASSCKKETAPTPTEISLSLPSQGSLRYGETQEIKLPKDLAAKAGLTFSFDFSQITDINLGNGIKLSDKLNQAIKFDNEKQSILINSSLLYPNGAQSSSARIPDDYKVSVIAKEDNGWIYCHQRFKKWQRVALFICALWRPIY